MQQVVRTAHAKINLALAVGPPRLADGFHPICSWFAPIDLADTLTLTRLADNAHSRHETAWADDAPRTSPIDWPIEKDLAVRAHRLIEAEVARPLPIAMRLTKRIPVGGGLGGGSSDAAAMLRALIELFDLRVPAAHLHTLALSLGSDVPYFLLDPLTPAIVEGVGDAIVPTPPIEGRLVLILPPFGCPTGSVYRAFDSLKPGPMRDTAVRNMALAAPRAESLFNDLALAAETIEPRLAHTRAVAARAIGQPVHVTGSGSTLFAIIDSGELPRHITALNDALPDCAVLDSCFLGGPHRSVPAAGPAPRRT
ncbi:MAG: hypothetical protein JNK58_01095 [Phycisphaerae bacterium]|nr:hypothetical protein [Phycisphaerae bacterium]